jgi:hypothetical protein
MNSTKFKIEAKKILILVYLLVISILELIFFT